MCNLGRASGSGNDIAGALSEEKVTGRMCVCEGEGEGQREDST